MAGAIESTVVIYGMMQPAVARGEEGFVEILQLLVGDWPVFRVE